MSILPAFPGSSTGASSKDGVSGAPAIKPEDAGASPAPGATTLTYVIVRDKLSGGALLAHVAHAAREAIGPAPSEDERMCVLVATKAQMEKLAGDLRQAEVPFKACIETDGPLAGTTPSIGLSLLLSEKPKLKPILGHLKPWSERACGEEVTS